MLLFGLTKDDRVLKLGFGAAALAFALVSGTLISGAMAPALAKTPAVYVNPKNQLAISGYDPVAYFTQGKPVPGDKQFSATYEGATWHFSSAANRDAFLKSPSAYAPQFGGYCALAVSKGATAKTEPENWKIVDGKLYLNYSDLAHAIWEQDIPGNISLGHKNWPAVLDK